MMNRIFFKNLLLGISVSLAFSCDGMYKQLSESNIMLPSLSLLSENFHAESSTFEQQTNKVLKDLKNVPGDDAHLLCLRLQQDLKTIALLKVLITTCKDDSNNTLKPEEKQKALRICQYLTRVIAYAGKMQDVILSVLKKEFDVDNINELESMITTNKSCDPN